MWKDPHREVHIVQDEGLPQPAVCTEAEQDDVQDKTAMQKTRSLRVSMFEQEIGHDHDVGKTNTMEATALKKILKEIDHNGHGELSVQDMLTAFKSLNASREQNKRLLKIVLGIIFFSVVAMSLMFGVTYAAVQASKDSKPTSFGVLETISGTPVTVSVTGYDVEPWQIPSQSFDFMASMKTFQMWGGDGKMHFYTIFGFTWTNSTYMQLFSALGDVITIDGKTVVAKGKDGVVTTNQGSAEGGNDPVIVPALVSAAKPVSKARKAGGGGQ